MRRNLDTLRTQFGEAVLPAGTDELAEDLRAGVAAGQLPPIDGSRLAERTPPDVEGATAFASALFLGALER